GHPAVGGADVENVAGVAIAGVGGRINVANYVVVCGRFTPAHVPPVRWVGIHIGEVARIAAVPAYERGAGVGVGPGIATISGAKDFVGSVVVGAATHLVHAGDVHVARDFVGGNLDVAGFAAVGRNLMRSRPSRAVISGEGGEEAANVAAIQDVVVV